MQELTDAERELLNVAMNQDHRIGAKLEKELWNAVAAVRRERLTREMPGWEDELRMAARRMHEAWRDWVKLRERLEPHAGYFECDRIMKEEEERCR